MIETILRPIDKIILTLAIWFLERAVGEPCEVEDEFVHEDFACLTCRTHRTIKLLREWLEIIKL